MALQLPAVPEGTTELGIDIIKVERIAAALERFGDRFPKRVLTDAEQRYVRNRPENFAGRWAAKEAVSKVLGLGVRGVGWTRDRDRAPADRRAVRAAPRARRAARRAAGHGPHRGLDQPRGRLRGGDRLRHPHARAAHYVFPPDIDERLDEHASGRYWRAWSGCASWRTRRASER